MSQSQELAIIATYYDLFNRQFAGIVAQTLDPSQACIITKNVVLKTAMENEEVRKKMISLLEKYPEASARMILENDNKKIDFYYDIVYDRIINESLGAIFPVTNEEKITFIVKFLQRFDMLDLVI